MNYKLVNDTSILETQTEQVFYNCKSKEDAKKFLRKFNNKSPFNGWTPAFVLKSVLKSKK